MAKSKGHIVLNIAYYTLITLFGLVLLRVFVFESYKIPTNSMEPRIIPGDYILVNKTAYGARLFDLFDAVDKKRATIKRVPGFSPITKNDIVVFHNPYPESWDKTEMDMSKFFIKRCIGTPGDTLCIKNGIYIINADTTQHYGNYTSELILSKKTKEMLGNNLYNAFPRDSILNWSIKDFGPLYIPQKKDNIFLNRTNSILYKKLIEWEKGYSLKLECNVLFDNGKPLWRYTFTHNYYFMGGDNVENSIDSRYWGLLPDDFVVGKAWLIWNSIEPYSGKIRWQRVLSSLQ